MEKQSILIIGAGIAGLSAGCYAQMNGFKTTILEKHTVPGGSCTAWKRKGYTFDYCIHDIAGISPNSGAYFIWQELGALKNKAIVYHDEFWRTEDIQGHSLHAYNSVNRMIQQLIEIAPEDEALIREYEKGLKSFLKIEFLAIPVLGIKGFINALPSIPAIIKWGGITMGAFAKRFKNPFLRRAFSTMQYDFAGIPMMLHMSFLASSQNHQLGWAAGGSYEFAESIAKRYVDLGGEICLKSAVEKVLVENGKAVGVKLTGGEELKADIVISAADGYSTIYKMLDGNFTNGQIDKYYATELESQEMSLHISFGVNRDLSSDPRALTFLLDEQIQIADVITDRLDIEFFGFEPSFAPKGKGVIKVLMKSGYRFWKALKEKGEDYQKAKDSAVTAVLKVLEIKLPGISKQVEVVDVATPVTAEHFLGSRFGYQAWGSEDFFKAMISGLSITLPGLTSFYMTGQWSMATIGISTAAISSRNLIKRICKQQGKKFTTSKA
jgi:phytoene dehydrogenase-like protein